MPAQVELCLGIDPQPAQSDRFEDFRLSLNCHEELLAKLVQTPSSQQRIKLKPNLSFFLRYGSQGVALLEKLCADSHKTFDIILDAKFNEIANSLAAQLDFAFNGLKAAGVTINPYLGERTIEEALTKAVKTNGERARVYVLCATSEFSKSHLSYLQQPEQLIEACVAVRERVLGDVYPHALGVVVGANRVDVLLSKFLHDSGCSVLAPGLGAQGASDEIVTTLKSKNLANEFVFPVSRGIFKGGTISGDEVYMNYTKFREKF